MTTVFWRIRSPTARRMARVAWNTSPLRSLAGRRPSESTGGNGMADRITMQVTRYRPEEESGATVNEYEVPCPKEWVVLDGLNYIKDRLDGTLSYRWSCRMGVCGSCGMMVNGEPSSRARRFCPSTATVRYASSHSGTSP